MLPFDSFLALSGRSYVTRNRHHIVKPDFWNPVNTSTALEKRLKRTESQLNIAQAPEVAGWGLLEYVSDLVRCVVGGNLVALCKSGVVEDCFHEVVQSAPEFEYRLPDMNQFGCAGAYAVDPQ